MKFFQGLLWASLAWLVLSVLGALTYEVYAVVSSQVPPISMIVIPWVRQHNIYASLIVGGVTGFLTFLVVHFFGARV